MLNLDELLGKTTTVVLDGERYTVPVGYDSMTLGTVAKGKPAQEALSKIGQEGASLTDAEVAKVIDFVATATGISADVLAGKPIRILTELIHLMFLGEREADVNAVAEDRG